MEHTYIYENPVDALCARGLICRPFGGAGDEDALSDFPDYVPERPTAQRSGAVDGFGLDAQYRAALTAYLQARGLWDRLAGALDGSDGAARDYQANLPARYEHLCALFDRVEELAFWRRGDAPKGGFPG